MPQHVLTNQDLEKMVDTSDEWITERTGIKERHIAKGISTAYMAIKASQKAMDSAWVTPDEIDIIIAATITPDYLTPSLSCLVQKEFGADSAFCFDINAACSGFCYALDIADLYIKTGRAKTILIVASEMLSRITDYTDRRTCVLFGDGAGAVIARAGDTKGVMDSICCAVGGLGDVLKASVFEDYKFIQMNGKEVYKFAVRVNIETITQLLSNNNLSTDDIAYLVPHQANKRIIATVSSKLGIDSDKTYINVDRYGNTSSASIPICLDEMNKKGLLKDGDKIILTGFGGGLTYAGILLQWVGM